MEVTKEQMLEIKKWEDENWFLAAKLQEECCLINIIYFV